MILLAFFGLIISFFSPALGLITVTPALVKQMMIDPKKIGVFYSTLVVLTFIALISNIIDWMILSNILINVALSSYIIVHAIHREKSIENALMNVFLVSSVLSGVKYLLFKDQIEKSVLLSIKNFSDMLKTRYTENSTEYQIISDTLTRSKDLYINYNYSFSIVLILIAVMLVFVILNRKPSIMLNIKTFSSPNVIIYGLISALILLISKQSNILAYNIILPCSTFFLIQGLSVSWYYVGQWIGQSKILMIFALLSLVLNPYLLMLIALIGFIDNWTDFRKLNKLEETHENNSH